MFITNYFNRPNATEHVSRLSCVKSNLYTASVPFKAIHEEPCWTARTGRHITIHTKRDSLLGFHFIVRVSSCPNSFSVDPLAAPSPTDGLTFLSDATNRGKCTGTVKAEPPANTVTVLPRRVGRLPSHSDSPRGPHLESIGMRSPSSSESCDRRMRRPQK